MYGVAFGNFLRSIRSMHGRWMMGWKRRPSIIATLEYGQAFQVTAGYSGLGITLVCAGHLLESPITTAYSASMYHTPTHIYFPSVHSVSVCVICQSYIERASPCIIQYSPILLMCEVRDYNDVYWHSKATMYILLCTIRMKSDIS